jgi:DNA-binding response OmpR family regulator
VAGHCPTIKTIMLTGNASLETAMAAINEGNIFRFFTKPCDIVELALAIRQALEQKAREESHLHQENTEKGRASATDRPVRCEVAFPNQLQAEKAIVDPFLRSETSETDSRGRFSRGIMMMEARVRRWLDRERIEGIETVFDVQVLERHREWEEYTAIPDAILLSFEEDKVSHVASICHGLKGVLWKNAPTILAFCYPGEDRSIASAFSVGFDECLSPRMGTEEMVARCLAAVRARRLDQVLAGGTDWGEEAPDALAAS